MCSLPSEFFLPVSSALCDGVQRGVYRKKYREIARMIGVEAQAEYRKSAIDTVRQLSIDVGQTLKKISVKEAELNAIAGVCTGGNPRPRTLRCIRLILRLVNIRILHTML